MNKDLVYSLLESTSKENRPNTALTIAMIDLIEKGEPFSKVIQAQRKSIEPEVNLDRPRFDGYSPEKQMDNLENFLRVHATTLGIKVE